MKSDTNRWNDARLGDLIELFTGFPFTSREFTDAPGDVRLLRGDNVGQGRLRWNGAKRWPAAQQPDFGEFELALGDVVLAMDRPWIEAGLKHAVVKTDDVPSLLVQRVARLRAVAELDQRFLGYLIADPRFTEYVKGVQTGTAVPHISGKQIQDYRISVPPKQEQRCIARVLGSLDDKIENNRRIAITLEEIAATLFKARFMDFVDHLDLRETEIGPIPTDWHVVPFSEAVDINPRVTSLKRDEDAPFIEMAATAPWATRPSRLGEREYRGGAKFEPGDTLMARITGCIEHGKGAFIDFIDSAGSGSTEFLVFRARPPLTPEAVFLLSRSQRVRDHAIANMTGSSGRQRVPTSCFDQLSVAIPPHTDTVRREAEAFRAIFEKTRALWRENQALSAVRDTLLPKLISGEIRVGDAETVVEEESRDPLRSSRLLG